MTSKVIQLFPEDIRENAVKMLRELADEIENGARADVDHGVVVFSRVDGTTSVYDFGPGCDGQLKTYALLSFGARLIQDTLL